MRVLLFFIFVVIGVSNSNLLLSQNVNSVLSSGYWLKIKVDKNAVYKITYFDLLNNGIGPSCLNPRNIKIYSNGNGMLPENLSELRENDLNEISIKIVGEEDTYFDTEDYILFYGTCPTKWSYDNLDSTFVHKTNIYDNYTYYFLTVGNTYGKRISDNSNLNLQPTNIVNTYNYYNVYEKDTFNLLKSGKLWLGEYFDDTLTYNINFDIPNLSVNNLLKIRTAVAASSYTLTSFTYKYDLQNILEVNVGTSNAYTIAKYETGNTEFYANSNNINVQVNYNRTDTSSKGWLDYIEINARVNLVADTTFTCFRDVNSVGVGNVSKFKIPNSSQIYKVWDITNFYNVSNQNYELVNDTIVFTTNTDSLKEFIVFDSTKAIEPISIYHIENQNLHAIESCDLLIITPAEFLTQANLLADFHTNNDDMLVVVVTTEQIYNEYSSGKQDVTAIRDFVASLNINKANGNSIQNLLLFGDASYDYKNISQNNTNYVPTYQTNESFSLIISIASDDFFGILDNSETFENGYVDIGIGRLPVKNISEAQIIVDKIINYKTNINSFGKWRNDFGFIADDGDGNLHMSQTEVFTNKVDTVDCCFNINKVYFDNYQEFGNEYPDAKSKLINEINSGELVVNYMGHGNVSGLDHNALTITDLSNIYNEFRLPFLIFGSSETGRYDNPQQQSFGEQMLLQANNMGSIGILSSARLVYSSQNFSFISNIYHKLLERDYYGEYNTLGDIIKYAKNNSSSSINKRSLCLLADPAITISYPKQLINVTQINNINIENFEDTINAGETVTITGEINNFTGDLQNGFDGDIYYKLYNDKRYDTTLISQFVYETLEDTLIIGNANVTNGHFNFSFVMPNGIDNLVEAKLSLYANSIETDAKGCTNLLCSESSNYVNNVFLDNSLTLYPTVSTQIINVEFNRKINNLNIDIFSMFGEKVFSLNNLTLKKHDVYSIDISNLSNGMYLVNISTVNGNTCKKIIKR